MGDVRLNTWETILLILLMPILLPTWAVVCLVVYLKESIRRLCRFLADDGSGDGARVSEHIAQPISSRHKLYKYATTGDTHGFEATLADLSSNEIIEILSHKTPQKNTYLHIAAALKSEALAVKIIESHPMLLWRQNDDGDSPLHIAAKEGNQGVVEAFLRKEGKIRAPGAIGGESATDAAENGFRFPFLQKMLNNQNNTPLQEALINGHSSAAKKLIESDPTATNFFQLVNKEDKSALYLAVEAGYVGLVKIMNKKSESLNNRVCGGKSPLQAAILSRSPQMLKIISSMSLEVSTPINEEDKTPLHHAASIGYMKGVRSVLLQSTADAYKKDPNGIFPIHAAASKGYIDIIQEFLKCCPDSAELLTTTGQNVLHVASKYGRDNVVSYALKNRMLRKLVNQQDNNGDTPLHLAAKFRHAMVASTLTWDKRTNMKLVNNEGFTALDIVEGDANIITSFCGRLTWIALKSGGAQRAQHLHILLRGEESMQPPNLNNTSQPSSSLNLNHTPQPSSRSLSQTHQSPNMDQMLGFHLVVGSKLPSLESFKDRVNTLLLVTTLVVTVTYAAGFTMPGGHNSSDPNSQGMAVMLTEVAFQIFIICDTIAMYCSIVVAVTLIWAQLGDLSLVLSALGLALPLLGISLTMMSAAFTAGVYVVVSNLRWLSGVILGIGGLFITIVMSLFVPLFFPSQSTNIIVRYLTYYPFRLAVLASGHCSKEVEE